MASPLVRAAWRVYRRSREQGQPVPAETRRILNDYRQPGAREYQRQKRAKDNHISANLFQALRDRGIPSIIINKQTRDLSPRARYIVVGRVYKDRRQSLAIMHYNTQDAVIKILSEAPFGAVVIDTKEIY